MIKQIIFVVFIAVFVSSCGNTGKKEVSKSEGSSEAVKITFTALVEKPDSYIDKNIIVEGKVVHVCPHTGKKLFIVGDNPDIRLYVEAGEGTAKFPMELLGSVISIEGKLTKMATPEKPMGEAGMNMAKDTCKAMTTGEPCETEAAVAAQPVLADMVLTYKSHSVK